MTDELLRALGERQARDPAAQPGADPVLAATMAPFEGDERTRLLDGVLDALDGLEGPRTEGSSPGSPAVVELSSRRRSIVPLAGAAVALAAAVVLWLGLRGPVAPAADAALPPYAATRLDGGTATMRSLDAPPSVLSLRPDAALDWILTPRSPVRAPVGAVILAVAPDQPGVLIEPRGLEVSAEGVVRITGAAAEVLPLAPGRWSITVVLGPPHALPHTAAEAEAEATTDAQAWSRVSFEVNILPAP